MPKLADHPRYPYPGWPDSCQDCSAPPRQSPDRPHPNDPELAPFLDHVDADHPVQVTRATNEYPWTITEYATIDEAARRLAGWYLDDPPGWIEDTLRRGTPLQTPGGVYRVFVDEPTTD